MLKIKIFIIILCLNACREASNNAKKQIQFNFDKNWYGADAAYSIEIDKNKQKVIWLFGDTFTDLEQDYPKFRRSSKIVLGTMLASSQFLEDGSFKLTHHWKHNSNGEKTSFFIPDNPKHWYWPRDPFIAHNKLYIPLIRLSHNTNDPFFQFQLEGADLAVIKNYKDNPLNWKINYFPLYRGSFISPAGTSFLYNKHYVYFYSQIPIMKANALQRIKINNLKNALTQTETRIKSSNKKIQWRINPNLEETYIYTDFPSELSVRYHSDLNKWIALYVSQEGSFFGNIVYKLADSPLGPWSKESLLYEIPENNPEDFRYHERNWCYAGKEHSEFQKPGQILFTYVCHNTQEDQKPLLENPNLYKPIVVELTFPPEKDL